MMTSDPDPSSAAHLAHLAQCAHPAGPVSLGPALRACALQVARTLNAPPLRALHLPPAAAQADGSGRFMAAELADGSVGLAFAALDGAEQDGLRAQEAVRRQPEAEAWLDAWADAAPWRRAVARATANALADHLHQRAGWHAPDDDDPWAGLAPQAGEAFGLVGLFTPLLPRLKALGARVVVLERNPALAGLHEGVPVTLDPSALHDCPKVLCTAATLINDTLGDVLASLKPGTQVAVAGPTANGFAGPLFDRGVVAIGSMRIRDRAAYLQALTRGEKARGVQVKTVLRPADDPGLAALLRRAQAAR